MLLRLAFLVPLFAVSLAFFLDALFVILCFQFNLFLPCFSVVVFIVVLHYCCCKVKIQLGSPFFPTLPLDKKKYFFPAKPFTI